MEKDRGEGRRKGMERYTKKVVRKRQRFKKKGDRAAKEGKKMGNIKYFLTQTVKWGVSFNNLV